VEKLAAQQNAVWKTTLRGYLEETIEYLSSYTKTGSAQTNHYNSKQPQLQFNFSENHT